MAHDFQSDLDSISRIDAIPTILDVVCRVTGMRFAAVARVTEDRWVTCSVLDTIDFGLKPGDELKVETTICHEVRAMTEAVVIDEVATNATYKSHHTPEMYGFQSYISVPILRRNGEFFGTLCAIDPLPRKLDNPETVGMFKMFAELIATHLDLEDQLSKANSALEVEREKSELRDQFIAVLGHDLRNPLASIESGANILLRNALDEPSRRVVRLMQGSTFRMRGLVNNVMDFARTRLGDGIGLSIGSDPLQPVLEQVVSELRLIAPEHQISASFDMAGAIPADSARIGQLLSNLLGNATSHGSTDKPIKVAARVNEGSFELTVENSGPEIPEAIREGLFRPFFRGGSGVKQGLGLGLYIASEIARAHGGTLTAASDDASTRFTFRMPAS